jgi:hypothetical protein
MVMTTTVMELLTGTRLIHTLGLSKI